MEPSKVVEHEGKFWVKWDTDDFREKLAAAGADQEALNNAVIRNEMEAVKIDGVWHYGLEGLNKTFPILPLGEGRGWSD